MKNKMGRVCLSILLTLMAFVVVAHPPALAAQESDCVIPESGPWPQCATGGGQSDPQTGGDECVIPPSGPWPTCATNEESESTATPSSDECVIPPSGPWPTCATDGGDSSAEPPSNGGTGEPCPASGAWPPGCVPNSAAETEPVITYVAADAGRLTREAWGFAHEPATQDCTNEETPNDFLLLATAMCIFDHTATDTDPYLRIVSQALVTVDVEGAQMLYNEWEQVWRGFWDQMGAPNVWELHSDWMLFCYEDGTEVNGQHQTFSACMLARQHQNLFWVVAITAHEADMEASVARLMARDLPAAGN